MYPNPNISSNTIQPSPSAPPPPTSTTTSSTSSLTNSNSGQPIGFSSLLTQLPSSQPTHNPTSQTSHSMYPGQGSQPPYPTGPSGPFSTPYPNNTQPPAANPGNYPPYPQQRNTAPPPPSSSGSGYPANPYGQSSNPYSSAPGGQQQQQQPYSGHQPPPPQQGSGGYQNPYASSNPYGQQPPNTGYQNPPRPNNPYNQPQGQQFNPYQQQQMQSGGYPPQQQPGGYPPQQQPGGYPPQQQPGGYPPQHQQQHPPQSQQYSSQYQNPYPPPPAPQGGGYGGYSPYQPMQPSYQSPYGQQNPGGGYSANNYRGPANDRIRAIAGRYEINDSLAQRLNILQQFELVVLCDDSGSMNTPVEGTRGTRWDELRSIVQIIIEIGTVFDSNGVDVHFLNRAAMPNVTDSRQVVESFSQPPSGFTPLTPALRRIFQSQASKPGNDKRLLVFVATDGAPTDANGTVDIHSLENLLRNERQANTTYVTFLACTDDANSVSYLSQWDRTMMNVDVVDDFKTEQEEVRRVRGYNYPFTFGDYVVKALLGAIDPQMDLLDEASNNNFNNNYNRF